MGKFTVKNITELSKMKIGEEIPESDYATLTPDGFFVQLKYQEDEEQIAVKTKLKPGIWTIQKSMQGLHLEKTEFNGDKLLETFIHTQHISDKIQCFFSRLDRYKKHNIDVPKRSMLLYGPAGTGKTSSIKKVVNQYVQDGETAIVIWATDKYEASVIKDFIKHFEYIDVKKMILICEDIGGVEAEEVRRHSDSSLLSLLDNQEKTFCIPTLIIATTNHPETFLGNLTNRPGRFADKIEVGFPSADSREQLLAFFLGKELSTEEKIIREDKYREFTPDHLKEAVIRSDIYDKTLAETLKEMAAELELYKKAFSNKQRMGFSLGSDD